MGSEDETISVDPDLNLSKLLEWAKRAGQLRLIDGEDVFIVRYQKEVLSEAARNFLVRGGPAEAD